MGNRGARYSDEFKAEAVNLVKKEGYSLQKAADRLGVHAVTIRNWIKVNESAGGDEFSGSPFEMQREIRRQKEQGSTTR